MPAPIAAGFWISLALIFPAAVVVCGFPAALTLERAFPRTGHGLALNQLKERDRVRHRRILQSGVVDFPVEGTYDPYLVGLYFTSVQLGTPPQEFYVQIDSGSDVLWVGCNSCSGCPTSSGLKISLNLFNPSGSSTASLVSCSDQRCTVGFQSSDSVCPTQNNPNNQCSYTFQYGDGSGTSGYYVSDLMHLNTVVGSSLVSNSSATVVFGLVWWIWNSCSMAATGDLTKTDRAVDGIFGFGQQGLSIVSQLYSQGVAPNAFSHCLIGSNNGGGILVLGEIVEPNIVYTPLVQSQPHYNLNLESISVNGQTLSIDSSVFATSSNGGTIVDSGTTLAYIAEEAYAPFVSGITSAVSQSSVRSIPSNGNQCYLTTSNISEVFPTVSLNFAGGASMLLYPEDYLLQQNSIAGAAVWCIGFQQIEGQGITILGDLFLQNKIIVYDLTGQRIGWTNYDCSLAVNVSASTANGKSTYVNPTQIGQNSSSRNTPLNSILLIIIVTLFLSNVSALRSFSLL
ncbi:hypothetical protein RHGRI_036630 [Rhododendron griersonianum]|uniref:Peptidase A1 domain-containing protein n=1 Tax=Rhododendron griersonianum TaxID=479676 RepID=A0AAV6HRU6_9ERIC|nr:hypothetical protein RHGRI_036630 [Rhododendron griersonianum]